MERERDRESEREKERERECVGESWMERERVRPVPRHVENKVEMPEHKCHSGKPSRGICLHVSLCEPPLPQRVLSASTSASVSLHCLKGCYLPPEVKGGGSNSRPNPTFKYKRPTDTKVGLSSEKCNRVISFPSFDVIGVLI